MNGRMPLSIGMALSLWLACATVESAELPDRTFAIESVRKYPIQRVYAMAQDRQGFLWLGSEMGIHRFDGNRFEIMSPRGMGAAVHFAILDDDRIVVVLRNEAIDSVVELRNGEFGPLPELGEIAGHTVSDFALDPRGRLRIVLESSVVIWDPAQHPPVVTREPVGSGMQENLAVALDAGGASWRITHGGEISRNGTAMARTVVGGGRTKWGGLTPFHDGVLVASDVGLWYHDASGSSRFRLVDLPKEFSVNTAFVDRNGDLWVATDYDGLYQLDINPLLRFIDSPDGAPAGAAFGIARAPDDSIWWTRGSGLGHITAGQVQFTTAPDELKLFLLRSLTVDLQGGVWVVDGSGRVFRFHDGIFSERALSEGLEIDVNSPIFHTRDGRMLLGLRSGGLAEWNKDRFVIVEGSKVGCPGDIVAFSEPHEGVLWFATAQAGLCHLDGKRWQHLGTADGLPENELRAIHVDGDGVVWIGGNHLGLFRYENRKFARVRLDLDLNHEEISSIVEDLEGSLWIATPVGLFRINRADANAMVLGHRSSVRTRSFTVEDGLRSRIFITRFSQSGLRDSAGTIWFPNLRGLVQVDPRQLRTPPLPEPVIERILVNGLALPKGSGEVERGSGNVIFRFLAPDLRNAHHLKFFHRLEGLESEWRDSGVTREVSYANLPAGTYTFAVAVAVADRDERREQRMTFALIPPWYRTRWFYSALVVLLLLAMVAIHRLRLMRLRLRFDIINDERARVARDLHDTLEQSLVGLKLQIESLGRSADEPLRVRSGLERARDLVGQAMRDMKGSIWALRMGAAGNLDLATAISVMAGQALRGTELRFALETRGTPYRLEPEAEQQLLRVLQEGLTNTIKYAKAQSVTVLLEFGDNGLRVVFGDDGLGFVSEGNRGPTEGHFGLSGMRERAAVLGANIEIHAKMDEGTKIVLELPQRWRRDTGRPNEPNKGGR